MASPQATSISVSDLARDNSDSVEVTSSTSPDTVLPSRAVHPATSTPAGFKIVKVRKPDGTIVKVRRPIKQDADGPSLSTTAPKLSTTIPSQAPIEQPAKLATPKIEPEINSEQPVGIQENVLVEQVPSPASTQTKTTEAKPKPTPQSTKNEKAIHSAKSPSRLATPAKTYKLYRTMHKIHRNFSRTVSAFDANGDMGDADDDISDMESGDDEIDDGSDAPSSDDDSDNNSNDDERNHESNSSTKEKPDSGTETVPPASKTGHSSTYSSTITPRRIKPEIQASTRAANGTSEKGTKSGIQINEKEIQPDTTTKSQSHQNTPRNLKRRSTISQCVIWGIMIVFPILYIILGILTATQTGAPVGSTIGSNVRTAIPFAVTAWPIIFAAIAAQSLKILATYKVERGLRLMTLEQLISSHSVAGAIKQPFLLRRLDWISIALLLLWSLSPLASQAMQHMAFTGSSTITNITQISYVNTTGTNIVFGNFAASSDSGQQLLQFQTEVDALYAASFVAPSYVQYSSQDLWNNTKIPNIEPLQGKSDQDGWYDATAAFRPTDFSSMLGIPFNVTNPALGLDMIFQSSYITITECSPLVVKTQNEVNHTNPYPTIDNQTPNLNYTLAISPSGTLIMSLNLFGDPFVLGSANGHDLYTPSRLPGTITFASLISGTPSTDPENPVFAYSACNITQTFVDSHLDCPQGEWCRVDQMRHTVNPGPTSGITPGFIQAFTNSTSAPGVLAHSFTERYILDPDHLDQEYDAFNITQTVPLPQFQARLALLLNTYWQAGFSPTEQTTGNLPDNIAGLVTTVANSTLAQDVYATNWGWLATLIICSVVLLVFGVAGAVWDAQTIGPDVLGFASGIIRHSKYIDLPKGDSTMTGAERARMLADVRVMMQDVKGDREVGRIALGTVGEGAQRLKRGRLYR